MTLDRRDLLNALALTGLGAGGALGPLLAEAQAPKPSVNSLNTGVYDFWHAKVRSPYDDFVANRQSQAVVAPDPADSTFLFLSETKGLTPAALLDATDIPNFPDKGDVSVSVHVDRFRPSAADRSALANLQSGTLRIDVKQVKPLPGLPEALAWTAMATLASKNPHQKIPTLDNVKFDPGTVWGQFQTVPLTGGLGFWSWNFFMKRREGFWGQLLNQLFSTIGTVQPLLPLLGLPGIAVSGLKYIDDILGGIQAQGDSAWMFRGLDIAVCATKQSLDDAGAKGATKLPLTSGNYVVFPQDKVAQLDSNLVIMDGYLVPRNTAPLKVYEAAANVLPNVSYMTVSVGVKTTAQTKAN
jgi:hypothetical protein